MALHPADNLSNASSYESQDGAQNEGVANAQNPSGKRSVGGECKVAPNQSMLDEATVSPTSLFVVVCAPPSHKRRVVLVRVLNVLWLPIQILDSFFINSLELKRSNEWPQSIYGQRKAN